MCVATVQRAGGAMTDDQATPEQFCDLLDRLADVRSRVQVVVGDLAGPVTVLAGLLRQGDDEHTYLIDGGQDNAVLPLVVADPERIGDAGVLSGDVVTANAWEVAVTCLIDGAVRLTVARYPD
jgi:hypothetical protein